MIRFVIFLFIIFASVAEAAEYIINGYNAGCTYPISGSKCVPTLSSGEMLVGQIECPIQNTNNVRLKYSTCPATHMNTPLRTFAPGVNCGNNAITLCVYNTECPAPGTSAGTQTFLPYQHLTCMSGCAVTQSSESTCTGTAAEGGSCTAQFTYTGSTCGDPPPDPEPGDGTPGDGDGDGGDNGGGDNGGGDNGGGGDGDGDGTGGTGDGDGDGTGGTGDGDGDGTGDKTGGALQSPNCNYPPVCDEEGSDACLAAIQSWRAICDFSTFNSSDLNSTGIYENTADKLYKEEDVREIFSAVLNSNPGPGGFCPNGPSFRVGGMSYEFSYLPLCDFSLRIRPLIIAMSYLIAFFIVFG